MDDRAEDEGWTHGCDGEIGVFFFEELPGCFFCEGFGGAVAVGGGLDGFFFGNGVPVFLAVSVAWARAEAGVEDGGERGRDHLDVALASLGIPRKFYSAHHSLDRRSMLLDGLQDPSSTDHSWI